MYPVYSEYMLNNFNAKTIPEDDFAETYSSSVLFNTNIGSVPYYNCQYYGGYYSPDKIADGVTNPQPSETEIDYKIGAEADPEQVMKDAMGVSFLYGSNSDGVRVSDNHVQYLKFLNAARYKTANYRIYVEVVRKSRYISYDEQTGEIDYDSGVVVNGPEQDIFSKGFSYFLWQRNRYSEEPVSYLDTEIHEWYEYKADFSKLGENGEADLINKFYAYQNLEQGKNPQAGGGTVTNTYDYQFAALSDGETYEQKAPATAEFEGVQGQSYHTRNRITVGRYCTEFKPQTIQSLANIYKVPI